MADPAPQTGPPAAGPDRSPTVVLLHGQPGTGAVWDEVTRHLGPGVHVMAPDRPGYGRSGGPAGDFGANADAVAALVAGAGPAVVVGHSWSGAVALTLAATRPELVAGLVLVSSVSPTVPPTTLDRLLARPALGEAAAWLSVGVSGWVLGSPSARRVVLSRVRGPAGRFLRDLPPGFGPWRTWLAEQRTYVADIGRLAPRLATVTVPTVVVHGGRDRTVSPAEGEALARALPSARLVRVPGAGHLLPLEAPAAVADAVTSLLGPARHAGTSPGDPGPTEAGPAGS